jgi:two-component system cell cycle sensor histidine kinase/response regulator CckA
MHTIRTSTRPAAAAARLKTDQVEPGDYVVCEVTDTGTGMTREVMAKMFEPFFSTKEVGKGTGLGLSTVYGIVKQTGGSIFCDSSIGKGTTFRIYLPRHRETGGGATVARSEKKERSKDLTGTGTVLLVEDEEAVRRFAARALTRQGYQVLEAGSGAEALEVMAGHSGTIDLVLSDVVMPEMDGPRLLKELRKQRPDLKIVFISGYAEDALKSLSGNEEFSFLAKPFQLKDLVAAVKDAMER